MTGDGDFDAINEAKANMDYIYDEPDPRAYFRELRKLNYSIPGAAKPVFKRLISALRRCRQEPLCVLDIGCSYGVNAALLKHDLSLSELYQHWNQDRLASATPGEVVKYDQRFFGHLEEPENIEMIGLDQAENAIGFAEEVGLIDDGIAIDLETEFLPEPVKEDLASVDLVMSTGCVGYVTEKTFDNLLPAITQGKSPWLANFVLRMFPFDVIAQTLDRWGYVTEKLEDTTFVQREFATQEEQAQVLEQLCEIGVDPTDMEDQGHLLAEFYLSRPKVHADRMPIEELFAA